MSTYIRITHLLIIISSLAVISTQNLEAQTYESSDIGFQINRVQKYVSISPKQLFDAELLSHLNHHYRQDWVKEYKSVKTIASVNGEKKEIVSKDDNLSQTQKALIQSADRNTDIVVIVKYLPDNNLAQNTIMEMDFSFRIDPDVEAEYTGGENELEKYISSKILKEVTLEDVPQYQVAAVKFVIDEKGRVVDARISQATNNKESDDLILNTVCEMPNWQSATYADGTKTKQEFVLTIGDHFSCTMNLLDIKSEVPASIRTEK